MNLSSRQLGIGGKSKSPSIPLLQRGKTSGNAPLLLSIGSYPPFGKGGQGGFALRPNGEES